MGIHTRFQPLPNLSTARPNLPALAEPDVLTCMRVLMAHRAVISYTRNGSSPWPAAYGLQYRL